MSFRRQFHWTDGDSTAAPPENVLKQRLAKLRSGCVKLAGHTPRAATMAHDFDD
jgi:hypothetical protein